MQGLSPVIGKWENGCTGGSVQKISHLLHMRCDWHRCEKEQQISISHPLQKKTHSSVIRIQGTDTSFVGEMTVTLLLHDEKGLHKCRDDVDFQPPVLHRISISDPVMIPVTGYPVAKFSSPSTALTPKISSKLSLCLLVKQVASSEREEGQEMGQHS